MCNIVKTINLILILLISCFVYGQNSNTMFFSGGNEFQQWTYHDFIKNDIKKIEAYSITIKKNGKISKDSILIFRQHFDKVDKKIYGTNCNTVFQSHGPSFLTWYKFETFYNNNGQVLKNLDEPLEIEKRKEFGSLNYDVDKNETLFEYDNKGQLVKKTDNRIENSYSISKYTKDTFHLHSIHPKIYEYFYNDRGQEISNYYTDDSTRYLPTRSYKTDSNAARCTYCDPRYLNGTRGYFENGKLKIWTWFTRANEIHSKKYYFYDDNLNLIKQVDSTGWYLQKYSNKNPSLESTTYFKYKDTTLIEKTNVRENWKSTEHYYNYGNLIKSCLVVDTTITCTEYTYNFKDNKVVSIISTNKNKDKTETYFIYNLRGQLYEKKVIYNNKTTQLTRYYYE